MFTIGHRARLQLPMALALLCAPVLADEVRLRDGRTLVGTTKTTGATLVVETVDGPVKVARDQVVRVRTTGELRTELDALASRTPDSAFGRLQLARTARDWGLTEELWQHLDRALDGCRAAPHLQGRLRAFMAELEPQVLPPKWRKARTEVRVRELLHRLRAKNPPESKVAAIVEILANEPGADAALRERSRGDGKAAQRLAAVSALSLRDGDVDHASFVYRTPIVDGSADVRRGAATWIASQGKAREAVSYLAPGLLHAHPTVRMRTAEAYGNLADPYAVDLLVAAGPLAGKLRAGSPGSVRGNIAILRQTSFVRDFDVEVAQASFIADPKIDVLQEGSVLDATVHAVVTHRTYIVGSYRRAITKITGEDPGSDTGKWAAWWDGRAGAHSARHRVSGSERDDAAAPRAAEGRAARRLPAVTDTRSQPAAPPAEARLSPYPRPTTRRPSAVPKLRDPRSPQQSSRGNDPLPGGRPANRPSPVVQPRTPAQPRIPATSPPGYGGRRR